MTDVSEKLKVPIIRVMEVKAITLMMEAVSTSETSVSFYQTTQHNITKDILILVALRI
jgi:hypothetical protein